MAEFTNRMLGLAEEILVEFIRESGGDVQPADMDKLIGAGAEWLVTMRFSLNHSIFGKALTRAVNEGRIVATELENGWHYTLGEARP